MEIECERITSFVDTIINCDTLDDCFIGFVKYNQEIELKQRELLTEQIINIFSIIPKEYLDDVVKVYISLIAKSTNYNQSHLFFSFIEVLIKKDILAPKDVCCHLLTPEFDFKNEYFWVNGLNFIHKIIHLVNYKGVRDILAILLSKISTVPVMSTNSVYLRIDSLYKLISYIFDRNEALLPAYLVMDEIQKKLQVIGTGHWKFSKKISSFIDSFRTVAKIVSISGRPKILPIVGYPSLRLNPFKWDHTSAKYRFKCLLPFDKELNEPQYSLMMHIIGQFNSKNALTVGGKNAVLEKSLVELVIETTTKTGNCKLIQQNNFENIDLNDPELNQIVFLWQHLVTTLFYVEWVVQNSHFTIDFIETLYNSIQQFDSTSMRNLLKSREFLMWLLLEIISTYVQKNVYERIISLYNFFDILYPEKEPLPLPDFSKQNSIYIMSSASIWCLLAKKSENDTIKIQTRVPKALKLHVEAIQEQVFGRSGSLSNVSEFQMVTLCNSFETNSEVYKKAFDYFTENIVGFRMIKTVGSLIELQQPVSMKVLDSLTVANKINLIQFITNHFVNLAQSKSTVPIPFSLLETYNRLLIYSEIETHGIKNFTNLVLNAITKNNSMNYLFTFLELFSFRLFSYHVNLSYKNKFLRQLHQYVKSNLVQVNHYQLYLYLESAVLKIIHSFNLTDFLSPTLQSGPILSEYLEYCDSEELSKIFVMVLARAIHITGSENLSPSFVTDVLKKTSLNWPNYTLKCFPSMISDYYQQQQAQGKTGSGNTNMNQIKMSVEEEHRKWKSITNESDLIKHFTSPTTPPLFYCLLYKMLLENEPLNKIVYKILDKIGVKSLCTHLRTFTDFLVNEFSSLRGDNYNKSFEALNDLIWKWNVFTIDRLLLCLALCGFEGNEIQVSIFIIQSLLFKKSEQPPNELLNIVNDFIRDNSAEHWRHPNWCERQMQFREKHSEKFYFEHLQDVGQGGQGQVQSCLPVAYGNLCYRTLPVFDLILHRLIELPPGPVVTPTFDSLLDKYGCLYKFHHQPITFLYNTLHYYEANLREKPDKKRNLVCSVINAFKEIRPKGWAVTEVFLAQCATKNNDESWNIGLDYYKQLVGRVVDTLSNQPRYPFTTMDYRFNEFPNVGTHALYVTCVELMSLPGNPKDVSNSLINLVLHNHKYFSREDIELWINAVALILTALPDSFSRVINDRIIELLKQPNFLEDKNLFYLFDFKSCHLHMNEYELSYMVALWHAYWSHASVGLLCSMPTFLKEKIKPVINNEEQFIFVCYLIGPFLQRFSVERTRCIVDITTELYEMLDIIDKRCSQLKYIDTICDLLYHNKYMFTGDLLKKDLEKKIQTMREDLKIRLRFI